LKGLFFPHLNLQHPDLEEEVIASSLSNDERRYVPSSNRFRAVKSHDYHGEWASEEPYSELYDANGWQNIFAARAGNLDETAGPKSP